MRACRPSNALIIEQQQAFKAQLVGRTLDILFDKKGRYGKQAHRPLAPTCNRSLSRTPIT